MSREFDVEKDRACSWSSTLSFSAASTTRSQIAEFAFELAALFRPFMRARQEDISFYLLAVERR